MAQATLNTACGPIPAPCLSVQSVPIDQVRPNTYNPNHISERRLKLLENSIAADGVCSPLVVAPDAGGYTIIDGYHRYLVLRDRLKATELPVIVLDRNPLERMGSTVRFNRARGTDRVERLADLVRRMAAAGMNDVSIAEQLGMEYDEVYRLGQLGGIAEAFADAPYSRAWEVHQGDPDK